MVSETYRLTVPFFDVDSMNIVWHGHYAKYLELARCKLLDKIGYNYAYMAKAGYSFPIIDMHVKYIQPIVFEQDIEIVATLTSWQFQLKIDYLIQDAKSGRRLTKATTKQAAVDLHTKAMRLECPSELVAKVEQLVQT